MWRTALACAVAAALAFGASHTLTHDFQVWTAEGARRLEVALQPVPAPQIAVTGPGLPAQPLAQLLAGDGRVHIVDFVYTRCVTLCTALGGIFQQMQRAIDSGSAFAPGSARAPATLALLSISFDPADDEPGTLQRYATRLQAQPEHWRFVRVADGHQRAALLARYRVTVIADGLGGFEHNAALLVVDQHGRLVRVFDTADALSAFNYASALAEAGAAR